MAKTIKRCVCVAAIGLLICICCALRELVHTNAGESVVHGSTGQGKLEHAYLMPFRGPNFSCFSPISYYLLDNAYTSSRVHAALIEAYSICVSTCPGRHFRVMELSNKGGGSMALHRTHQNGLSADFMVPLSNRKGPVYRYARLGLWHYLLQFDDDGKLKLSKGTSIDFETMAQHLLALDDAALQNGLSIKKVILKIELKDDLFATPSGQELLRRGIYFAQALPPGVNAMHDDHYHVDFGLR